MKLNEGLEHGLMLIGFYFCIFQLELNNHYGRNRSKVLNYLLHPETRGTVQLRSLDPYDPPLIDPKYLQNKNDFRMMLAGEGFSCIVYSIIPTNIFNLKVRCTIYCCRYAWFETDNL